MMTKRGCGVHALIGVMEFVFCPQPLRVFEAMSPILKKVIESIGEESQDECDKQISMIVPWHMNESGSGQ